jgi:hypothetical protein
MVQDINLILTRRVEFLLFLAIIEISQVDNTVLVLELKELMSRRGY